MTEHIQVSLCLIQQKQTDSSTIPTCKQCPILKVPASLNTQEMHLLVYTQNNSSENYTSSDMTVLYMSSPGSQDSEVEQLYRLMTINSLSDSIT